MGEIVGNTWVSDYSGAEIDERLSRATPWGTTGHNLFDNAYFIGGGTPGMFPVNQRGATGASAYPNNGAGIDRWHTANGASVGVLSSGVRVTSSTQYGAFRQNMDEQRLTEGVVYTLSILTTSGFYSQPSTPSKSAAWNGTPYESGFYPYLFWDGYYSRWVFAIASNANASGETQSITIKAAKLELGSCQTLARRVNGSWVLNDSPPNYGEELAKCQRYFQVFRTQSLRPVYGVDFRPPMAADEPALSSFVLDNVTYYTASAEQ